MRQKIQLCCLTAAATLGLGVLVAEAQSLYGRFLDRFDVNKDGKISRAEVPEGALRNTFDRMAEQYQLDSKKVYTREEMEKILGVTSSPPSGGSAPPGGSSSRPGRGGGGFRSESAGGPKGTASSRGDSRAYRALVELPDEYRRHDKDGDGQVGLYEWPRDRIAEFIKLDKNGDGFLTVEELKKPGTREASKEEKKPAKPADAPPAEGQPPEKPAVTETPVP